MPREDLTRDRVERDEETLNRTWRLILYMGTMSRNISELMSRFRTFLSTLISFFFPAYFISKGWQPSLFLISLTRNLIPSNIVITSNSAPVKSLGCIPFNECMCAVPVLPRSSSLPTRCKSVDSLVRGTCHNLTGAEQTSRKEALPIPGTGKGNTDPFYLPTA